MGYPSLRACVRDLERTRQLVRIDAETDSFLEIAEIQRRVYAAGGPALLFTRVKGSQFPMVCNLFGTLERARFLFRGTLEAVRRAVELKIDANAFFKKPLRYWRWPWTAWTSMPRRVHRAPVLECTTTVDQLPRQVSWPKDGGPFITLPEVYTEDPDRPGWRHSNLGMYRIQLAGNHYRRNEQVGMHYQIHRGIGVHHAAALRRGEALKVVVHVGGPPAFILAAVMPLPEGLSELIFAGMLGGRRVRMVPQASHLPILADADFAIVGHIKPGEELPEGPFGDHLGYYCKVHDFPVLTVEKVYHRRDAIWPFTVVGRPPQEDTTFGKLIHELTGPLIPKVLPGVKAVHAVDAAGVHPLLLAIGSERYVPYAKVRRPQELLTQANALLGQGQLSLAKYLFMVAHEDNPDLDIHDVAAFLRQALERVDWTTDLHFQTRTTIDTLDYSGPGLNEGSKVVIAAAGPRRRELPAEVGGDLHLPDGFRAPRVALPGVLAIEGPKYAAEGGGAAERFAATYSPGDSINRFPLVIIVDDSAFVARTLENLLWVAFTRSDPASNLYGIGSFIEQKHWGCAGALVMDARLKPHHAEPLAADSAVARRIESLAAPGGPLFGIF
jgi:4-hydroxy-3-polyprenylbenzoate decarboxylase